MNTPDQARMRTELERGRAALLQAVGGVSDDAAATPPAPGRWSVLECVEHVAVVEDYLLSHIESATHSDVPVVNEKREALISVRGMDRSRAIVCPELALPAGRYATLGLAIDAFLSARQRTIRFVDACAIDLRCELLLHPIAGQVNGFEAIMMIAVHTHRHAQQIEEIRSGRR